MPANANLPDSNPKTRFGVKKPPIGLVPPTAIINLASVMALGAEKYGAFNWRTQAVSSSVYRDAMLRHLYAWMDGQDTDAESGQSHLAHVMACCAILLDAASLEQLNDDRPVTGCAARTIEESTK